MIYSSNQNDVIKKSLNKLYQWYSYYKLVLITCSIIIDITDK